MTRPTRRPRALYVVGLKHGEDTAHRGIVAALHDIQDCYVNEGTGIVLSDTATGEAWRIVGPHRTPRAVAL